MAVRDVTSRKGEFTVYNFEVQNTHTYFAGDWWVHNACESVQKQGYEAEEAFRKWLIEIKHLNLYPKNGGNTGGPDARVSPDSPVRPEWNFAELAHKGGKYYKSKLNRDVRRRFRAGMEGPAGMYSWEKKGDEFLFELYKIRTK